jgi:signal transduction histidine kinase
MNKLLYRWMRTGILVLLFIKPGPSVAQEFPSISTRPFTTRDTAEVLKLIRIGNDIVYQHTDSALQLYIKAEQLSRNSGYNDGIGYALANKGLALTTKGYFDKGFACYNAALPYCLNALHLKYALIHLYFNMALSWSDKEDYLKANAYYHKVIDLVQERIPGNYQFLMAVYNNMVGVQVNMGSPELALSYIDKAMQLAIAHNKKSQLAQIILNKGDIYFSLKKYDSALYYYTSASKYVTELRDNHLQQSYNLRMGDVLLEKNKHEEALIYLQKANLLDNPEHPLMGIQVGYSLGDALYRLNRNKEAETILLKALATAVRTGLVKNKQNGHAVLMELYKKEGRFKEAYEQQRQYLQLSDSIINVEKIRAVNDIEIKYQVAQKDKAIIQKELKIAQQGKKLYRNKIIFISLSAGIILLSISGFAFYRYKQKISLRDRKIEQLKARMDGEEKERVRLSRELHDGLGGMLTGIKLNLRSIQRQPDVAAIKENLAGVMDMLQDMGDEIRQAAHNLMPDILLKHRLKEALELYCEQLDTGGKLKIDLQFYGDFQHLDVTMELQLYRIIQELLQNIIRHADAGFAAIQVRYNEGTLCISVEDDGIGFDAEQESTGAGLSNIQARVKALNGYFSVASTPGIGTTAYIEFNPDHKSIHA